MASSSASKPYFLLAHLLALLFIALKLAGVIRWSWLWVLAPLWIAVLLCLAVIGASLALREGNYP